MAVNVFEVREFGAFNGQQLMFNPLKMLANDVQAGFGQQMVDIGHPAGHRIVDRHHGEVRAPLADGGEHVLERGAGQRG